MGHSGQALCIRLCHEDMILTRKSHNCAGIAFIQGDSAGGSKLIEQNLIGLLRSCLVSLILAAFVLTKWLTQISVDCNRFNKGEINEVRIEWIFKRIQK